MPLTHSITQKRLKELLRYAPGSGVFTWGVGRSGTNGIGSVAGYLASDGYIHIRIDSVLHKAHRLAFLYMKGRIPAEVDHDDQVRSNNRWKNLNPATKTLNSRNKSLYSRNTSGICGVHWNAFRRKWIAQICVEDKRTHLGYFTTRRDAVAARRAANIKYKFHKNHGRT